RFFFQAEDGIRDFHVTGVQTCALPICMWLHPATQANLALLEERGLLTVGPDEGAMACNEFGFGRMAEPAEILAAIEAFFSTAERSEERRVGKECTVGGWAVHGNEEVKS